MPYSDLRNYNYKYHILVIDPNDYWNDFRDELEEEFYLNNKTWEEEPWRCIIQSNDTFIDIYFDSDEICELIKSYSKFTALVYTDHNEDEINKQYDKNEKFKRDINNIKKTFGGLNFNVKKLKDSELEYWIIVLDAGYKDAVKQQYRLNNFILIQNICVKRKRECEEELERRRNLEELRLEREKEIQEEKQYRIKQREKIKKEFFENVQYKQGAREYCWECGKAVYVNYSPPKLIDEGRGFFYYESDRICPNCGDRGHKSSTTLHSERFQNPWYIIKNGFLPFFFY